MRRVTGHAPFGLQRRVLIREGTLFVRVTLNASGVCAGSQPGLLEFKTAVRIVAIAALHRSLEDFVMKRLIEIRLCFSMTTHAELRFGLFEQLDG